MKQYSLEILNLRDRVVRGDEKLFQAWLQIREMNGEEKEKQLDRWNEAQEKLHYLNLELKAKGYCDCLYRNEKGEKTKRCLDEPNGWWCNVCSSSYPYWETELMSLASPSSA